MYRLSQLGSRHKNCNYYQDYYQEGEEEARVRMYQTQSQVSAVYVSSHASFRAVEPDVLDLYTTPYHHHFVQVFFFRSRFATVSLSFILQVSSRSNPSAQRQKDLTVCQND